VNRFEQKLEQHGLKLRRAPLQTLQINVGRKCNQACRHCHVDAAPWRTEMIEAPTARRIGKWIQQHRPPIVDITGAELLQNAERYEGVMVRIWSAVVTNSLMVSARLRALASFRSLS